MKILPPRCLNYKSRNRFPAGNAGPLCKRVFRYQFFEAGALWIGISYWYIFWLSGLKKEHIPFKTKTKILYQQFNAKETCWTVPLSLKIKFWGLNAKGGPFY